MAGNVSSVMGVLRRAGPNLENASADDFSALTDVPVFLGYMFSYFLDGILIVQVFLYYLSFRRTDNIYLKITVFTVFFAQLLSTVLAIEIIITSIIQFEDLFNSIEMLGFKAVALLCGLCVTMVHVFYSWRIRTLGGSWWIIAAVMVLSVVQCIMLAISGFGVFQGQYSGFLGAVTASLIDSGLISINILWLAGSAVADIIIATTLLYLLRRLPLTRSATRMERVMNAVIDTGMITAIATSIELLLFLLLPNTLVHFVMFYALPKLYANCLMSTLNGRRNGFRKDSFGLNMWSQWQFNPDGNSCKEEMATPRSSLTECSLDIESLSNSETSAMLTSSMYSARGM